MKKYTGKHMVHSCCNLGSRPSSRTRYCFPHTHNRCMGKWFVKWILLFWLWQLIMTSQHGSVFCITGPLRGESTGHRAVCYTNLLQFSAFLSLEAWQADDLTVINALDGYKVISASTFPFHCFWTILQPRCKLNACTGETILEIQSNMLVHSHIRSNFLKLAWFPQC